MIMSIDRVKCSCVFHYSTHEKPESLTIINMEHNGSQHHHHYQKTAEELCLRLSMGLIISSTVCHRTTNSSHSAPKRTSFSIVIPAGQDISLVYVGWTTQDFKYYPELFQKSLLNDNTPVGCQSIKVIDSNGVSVEYVAGYMICLVNLAKKCKVTRLDSTSDNVSSDFTVGCIIDQRTATISYTINDKEPIKGCDIKVSVNIIQGLLVYVNCYCRSVTLLSFSLQ